MTSMARPVAGVLHGVARGGVARKAPEWLRRGSHRRRRSTRRCRARRAVPVVVVPVVSVPDMVPASS